MDEDIKAALMEAGQRINALAANERRLIDKMYELQKDADRYRKLRDKGADLGLRSIFNLLPSEWDEAIDAAAPEEPAVGAA